MCPLEIFAHCFSRGLRLADVWRVSMHDPLRPPLFKICFFLLTRTVHLRRSRSHDPKPSKVRSSKPMKDWGTHNRDRLVRSLQLYGFGRWNRIRKEAGASIRSLEVGGVGKAGWVNTSSRRHSLQLQLLRSHLLSLFTFSPGNFDLWCKVHSRQRGIRWARGDQSALLRCCRRLLDRSAGGAGPIRKLCRHHQSSSPCRWTH